MKSLLAGIVVILTLSFILPVATLAQSGILEGTWESVSVKTTSPDGITVGERNRDDPDDKGGSIKILNATHFAVVGHHADGSFAWVYAGTYTVEGNTYTEFVTIAANPDLVGLENPAEFITNAANPDWVGWENPAEFTLKGDILKTKRILSNKNIVEETWRRVKVE